MPVPTTPMAISTQAIAATAQDVAVEFAQHRRLSVRQRKRWLELLFNWEQKNSYAVFDEEGQHALQVKEEGNGLVNLLKRLLLRTARPFTSVVYDNPIPKPLLVLHRPFRFFFHRLDVTAADGTPLGAVVKQWSWLRRIYVVEDARGRELARLFGPILRPWTFEIQVNGEERGTIQKRWSGFTKEWLTDADNFAVELTAVDDPMLRALCFAATVLVDVVHFEQSGSR